MSGFVADKIPRNLTRFIAAFYLISCAAMLWFTLICFKVRSLAAPPLAHVITVCLCDARNLQVLPYSLPAVYASSISVGLFMCPPPPVAKLQCKCVQLTRRAAAGTPRTPCSSSS